MPPMANLHLTLFLLLSILPLLYAASELPQYPLHIVPYIIDYGNGTIVRDNTTVPTVIFPARNDTDVLSKDITINVPSRERPLGARVFLPTQLDSNRRIPVLVYFHGGGFCIGSPFSKNDSIYLAKLAAQAKVIALSLDYILYPDGAVSDSYEDAWAFLKWVASHKVGANLPESDPWLAQFGDLDRVFVGGDSAGGNIAHRMAIRAGEDQLPGSVRLAGAFLAMPYFLGSSRVGSEPTNINETSNYNIWKYICENCTAGVDNPFINPGGPGAPSLRGLGCERMMVYAAKNDELHARDVWYYQLVKDSGWPGRIELVEAADQGHVFHIMDPNSAAASTLIENVGKFLNVSAGLVS